MEQKMRRILELAGIDISQGKAKVLIENEKIDLRRNGDEDLIDMFNSDEGLYQVAKHAQSFNELEEYADMFFQYTPEQLDELKQYFYDEHFD